MGLSKSYDAIVVGGGIIGSSCAFQLLKHGLKNVLVLEKGNTFGLGSTGFSSAVLRTRYSFDNTVKLAKEGLDAFLNWQDFLGMNEVKGHVVQSGILWIMNESKQKIEAEVTRFKKLNIACSILDQKQLNEKYPSFSSCQKFVDLSGEFLHECNGDNSGYFFYEEEGGFADPVSANEDLLNAAIRLGCNIRFQSRVIKINLNGGKVSSVTTSQGETIYSPILINATGAWCNQLNDLAGISTPWTLIPTRIQIVLRDKPHLFRGGLPVFADSAGGIYGRSEANGQQILIGSILPEDESEKVEDPDAYNTLLDPDFRDLKLLALQHRIPLCNTRSNERGYAALYTINREDMHPIVGESDLCGFYFVNGCSGHGFKLSPSLGSLIAQLITKQKSTLDSKVDPSFLSPKREPLQLSVKNVLA